MAAERCSVCAEVAGQIAAPGGPIFENEGWIVAAVERAVRPERVYVACWGERVRHVHFFLLPRTRSLPAGHVTSDLYRKGRSLLRRWGVAANPPTAARAGAAARIRNDEAWKALST
jgi:hypothetical protein